MQRSLHSHFLIVILLTLAAVNLFILDLKFFTPASLLTLSDISTTATPAPIKTSESAMITTTPNQICTDSCRELIRQATASTAYNQPRIGSVSEMGTAPRQNTSVQREYYIPLGSGETNKPDWNDLLTTDTVIDPSNYGKIREAYFIASMKNPTQNGQTDVQIFSVTDRHPVWNSQVTMNGPLAQTITSGKISFDTGNKLYRVQMKNSMGYTVQLENAKIRIVTE